MIQPGFNVIPGQLAPFFDLPLFKVINHSPVFIEQLVLGVR
jgi:uncharacterized membrane protein